MTRQRHPEAGFALLFVYAMAATVAVMLLLQLPSAAFEAQRDREQLLIDRGEQYSRGIQLYVRKFNRYPADFDALDNTQGMRFLRHRYSDPITGKDEWRLVHVGPGGVFTDSLLYTKKKDPNEAGKQNFITELPTVVDPVTGTAGVNIATRRGAATGTYNPNDPNSPLPGQPGSVQPGQQTIPGYPGTVISGQSGQLPGLNQQQLPGGLPPGVQLPPGTQLPPGIQMPGQAGSVPGTAAGGAATNLINQLLTTPRPGGLGGLSTTGTPQTTVDAFGNPVGGTATSGLPGAAGATGAPGQPVGVGQPVAGQGATGQTIGGGIAGVASKLEQEGIKRYRERTLYNEWEFVYDISKDTSRAGAGQPQGGVVPAAGATPATGAAPVSPTAPANSAPTTPPTPRSISGAASGSISVFPSLGGGGLTQPVQSGTPGQLGASGQPGGQPGAQPGVQPGIPSGTAGQLVIPGQNAPPSPNPLTPGTSSGTPGVPSTTPGIPPGLTIPPGLPIPGAAPPQQ